MIELIIFVSWPFLMLTIDGQPWDISGVSHGAAAREGNLQKALCAAFPKHFEDLQQQMALADPDEAHGQAGFR